MALEFPSNPTNGQVFDDYFWDASIGAWRGIGSPNNLGTQLGAVVARQYNPNVVINGAGDIWQRGGAVSVADGGYGPDRWRRAANGSGGACAFFQVPNSPADTDTTKSPSQFYMRYQWTSAPTSQTYNVLQQTIEDVRTFAGQTVTLSFWAKSPTNASMIIRPVLHQFFGVGGSTDVVLNGSNITVTGSWQKFSATFNVPGISGKTINANNWLGVEFDFFNFLNTTFAFDYTNVQLEIGSTPTPFRRNANSIDGELSACRRYYQTGGETWWSGSVVTGNNYHTSAQLVPTMRTTPTITTTRIGSQAFSTSAPVPQTVQRPTAFDVYLNCVSTDGRGYYAFNWTASAEL